MPISVLGLAEARSILLLWTVVLSFIALILMGLDKAGAKLRRQRVSESTFGLIALIGGFLGIILGGVIFNHKVSKARFWVPVLTGLILWSALFLIEFGELHI